MSAVAEGGLGVPVHSWKAKLNDSLLQSFAFSKTARTESQEIISWERCHSSLTSSFAFLLYCRAAFRNADWNAILKQQEIHMRLTPSSLNTRYAETLPKGLCFTAFSSRDNDIKTAAFMDSRKKEQEYFPSTWMEKHNCELPILRTRSWAAVQQLFPRKVFPASTWAAGSSVAE